MSPSVLVVLNLVFVLEVTKKLLSFCCWCCCSFVHVVHRCFGISLVEKRNREDKKKRNRSVFCFFKQNKNKSKILEENQAWKRVVHFLKKKVHFKSRRRRRRIHTKCFVTSSTAKFGLSRRTIQILGQKVFTRPLRKFNLILFSFWLSPKALF